MLAEIPFLHSQRSSREVRLPACSWLGLSAKLVVLLLICTNLVRIQHIVQHKHAMFCSRTEVAVRCSGVMRL